MGARGFSQLGTQVPCLLSCCRGKLDILFFGTPLDARTIGVFMATLLSSLSHIIRYRAVIRIRAWKIPGILSQALNCFNFQISTIGGILHWFWYHKRPTTPLLKRSRIRPWSRGRRAIFLSDTFFSLKSWFFLVFAFYYFFFFVCVCVWFLCVCVCVCVCVRVCFLFCFCFCFVSGFCFCHPFLFFCPSSCAQLTIKHSEKLTEMCTQEGIGQVVWSGDKNTQKHNNLEFAIYNLDFMKNLIKH